MTKMLMAPMQQMLPLSQQEMLRERWNERVKSPLAFTPNSLSGRLTRESARTANEELGAFASNHLEAFLGGANSAEQARRLFGAKKVLALGCGRAYDMHWLPAAVKAGLQAVWLDVSDVAVAFGADSLNSQWRDLEALEFRHPRPQIKRAEIHSALAEPGIVGLDLEEIEVWYACRFIGCLSRPSARFVLETMGCSLREDHNEQKKNAIVLVQALRDDNPDFESKTSTLYSRSSLLRRIRSGAQRPIQIVAEDKHSFLGKLVTAMTIQAK